MDATSCANFWTACSREICAMDFPPQTSLARLFRQLTSRLLYHVLVGFGATTGQFSQINQMVLIATKIVRITSIEQRSLGYSADRRDNAAGPVQDAVR